MSSSLRWVCKNLDTQEIVRVGDPVTLVLSGAVYIVEALKTPTVSDPHGYITGKSDDIKTRNLHAAFLPEAVNCKFEQVSAIESGESQME